MTLCSLVALSTAEIACLLRLILQALAILPTTQPPLLLNGRLMLRGRQALRTPVRCIDDQKLCMSANMSCLSRHSLHHKHRFRLHYVNGRQLQHIYQHLERHSLHDKNRFRLLYID